MSLERKIFLICPVRKATDPEKEFLKRYVSELERQGHKVHYPKRNTNQNDPVGYDICSENRAAIENADEVHIYFNPESPGSLFDFGMAFMAKKPITFINAEDIPRTPEKSFQNVLHALDEME